MKERILKLDAESEKKVDIAFFLGGFFFDVFTLTDVDNLIGIGQQLAYLSLLGGLLYYDFLDSRGLFKIPSRWEKFWVYRQPAMHFLLGSLLSLYSLFFLKSASMFSSVVFVAFLAIVMIANELRVVRDRGVNVKIGLYVICVFSFFSITVPVILGFVGYFPFFLSLLLTALVLYLVFQLLMLKVKDRRLLIRNLLGPGTVVIAFFMAFYMLGLIPPVPLSATSMGIYHNVEKVDGKYYAYHQNSRWSLWHGQGDREFIAEPNDKIYFFTQIFSPARFSDSVIVHWYFKDPRAGWQSMDRIPMNITGGRKQGYRGFTVKQNYHSGQWRVSLETTDGREIGRIYFEIVQVPELLTTRTFYREEF